MAKVPSRRTSVGLALSLFNSAGALLFKPDAVAVMATHS